MHSQKNNYKLKLSQYFDWKFMKHALLIMSPLIGQSLLIALMNVLDVFMIGAFIGKQAISGVGVANNILQIILFIFFATNMAGSIYASQYYGANNIQKMREVNNIRLMINFLLALIFTIITFLLSDKLINLILATNNNSLVSDNNSALQYGVTYLRIVIWSYPLLSIIFVFYQNMNECNKTYLPFIFTLLPVLVNGALNYIFLRFLDMKITGVAIPTVISRVLEITILLIFIVIKKPFFTPLKRFWYIDKALFNKIFKSLIPIFLANILFVFSVIAQTAIYSHFGGENILASTVITMTVMGIFYALFSSYSAITPIFIGPYLGAGNPKQAVANLKKILGLVFLIDMLLAILIFTLSFFIFDLLFDNKIPNEVIEISRFYLALQSIAYFFLSFSIIFFSVIRAGGFVKTATVIDILCTWIIIVIIPLIVSVITMKYAPNFDYRYIFVISTVGEVIQFIIITACVIKLKWAIKLI